MIQYRPEIPWHARFILVPLFNFLEAIIQLQKA